MDHQTQQPLMDRSTNTLLGSNTDTPNGQGAENMSLEYHRQVLQEKIQSGEKASTHYVSPSDGIMSPCTKKLSDIKGKRFKNVGKGQSLFAKTLGKRSFDKANDEAKSDASL